MKKVCFIGGIHGVGKTTFCKQLITNLNNCKYLSASDIIKKYKNSNEFDTKRVKDINRNQLLLINGLKEEKKDSNILLDGHFVLLNKENNIKKIDKTTYENLNIDCVLLLLDSPENIKQKLDKRGKNNFNLDLLENMQNMEKEWGKEIAKMLNIPYLEIDFKKNESSIETALHFIKAIL